MATSFVCPIDGALPADNGTTTSNTSNVPNSNSDAVVTGSGAIGSSVGTTVIVSTGANYPAGTNIQIPTRNETMAVTSVSTNTLTVTRASLWKNGIVVPNGTASASIAIGDVILTGIGTDGNPWHCPICGSATLPMNPAFVTTLTGVASGSQHPADADVTYGAATDSPLSQFATASYTLSGERQAVYPPKRSTASGSWGTFDAQGQPTVWTSGGTQVNRGWAAVTPETINATVGP